MVTIYNIFHVGNDCYFSLSLWVFHRKIYFRVKTIQLKWHTFRSKFYSFPSWLSNICLSSNVIGGEPAISMCFVVSLGFKKSHSLCFRKIWMWIVFDCVDKSFPSSNICIEIRNKKSKSKSFRCIWCIMYSHSLC